MNSEILSKDNNVVKLKLTIDAESFDKATQDAYLKQRGKMNIQGFRKGKAPRVIIEKMYGEGIFYEDAINEVFPEAYDLAVKDLGIEPVSRPEIDVEEVGKGQDLVIIAEVTVKPQVELGEYKGLDVQKQTSEVTSEEIDKDIASKQDQNARFITIEDRPVKEDDMILLDFNGKVDGVEFPGGKASNYSLVIGSNTFIPGFEEQLVGVELNQEKDIEITFPEDYQEASLAGKAATFTVKVNEIKEKELPELDDEFAKDVSEFDTLEELRGDVKSKLQETQDKAAENAFENELVKKATENATIEIPPIMIENQIDNMLYDFEYQLRYQGLSLDKYVEFTGGSMDQLRDQMRPDALDRVKSSLVIEAIGKAEGIAANDEDMDAEISKMAESYKMEPEKLRESLREQDLDYIKDTVIARKIVEFLKENAK